MIDGWQVETIEPERVVLHHGDTVEAITLEDTAQPAPPKAGLQLRKDERLDDGTQ